MMDYARSDTHYLLYIYDLLREELLAGSATHQNLLRAVLQRSALTSALVYEKEPYDAEHGRGVGGWSNLLTKWRHSMNQQQLYVFKALHQWRDTTARQEDESIRYVLPNHMLLALVERMPTDSPGVIGCCNPCPPSIRRNAQAIYMLIQRAKADALNQHDRTTEKKQQPSLQQQQQPIVQNTTAKQVKVVVDPSAFDLEKIHKDRQDTITHLASPHSVLFGTSAPSSSSTADRDAQAIANHIRATLTIALPMDDLKIKAVLDHADIRRKEQNPSSPEEADEEHVYAKPEQRETKKKRPASDKDVITVKSLGTKKSRKIQ